MNDIIEDEIVFEIEVVKKNKKSIYNSINFTQSQSHGLFWDNEIREKVFGLPPCKNDTTKYDISCQDNKFNNLENISIKTSGNNNIDCGDILRFFNGDFKKKYTIILIKYLQIENKKCILEILEMDYNMELRNYLFGTITEEILKNYVSYIHSIPHGPVPQCIKENYKNIKNELQKTHYMNINISPKVDSKSQRRVQCSITNVNKLVQQFPNIIISYTKSNIIRGIEITGTINSEPRKRNKKM